MARNGRKRVSLGPGNVWQSTLDKLEGHEPSQAGEVPAGLEEGRGGGDKGIDALTGGGGYAGDAVESGHDAALAEPDRPTDSEIAGDPRTHEGAPFPDEATQTDDEQGTIGQREGVERDRETE